MKENTWETCFLLRTRCGCRWDWTGLKPNYALLNLHVPVLTLVSPNSRQLLSRPTHISILVSPLSTHLQDWYSPYYKDSHFKLAKWGREVCQTVLEPHVDEWEAAEHVPNEVYVKWSQLGLTAFGHAPDVYKYLRPDFPIPIGLKPDEIDGFHHIALGNELGKVGSGGVLGGVSGLKLLHLPQVRSLLTRSCDAQPEVSLSVFRRSSISGLPR